MFLLAHLWLFALALRMTAPVIEFLLHKKLHWLDWIYHMPCAWLLRENARLFDYWPVLLPISLVVIAGTLRAIDQIKAKREEQIYRNENRY